MILVIDIGNSNIVVGCIEGAHTYFIERMATDRKRTALEYRGRHYFFCSAPINRLYT